ARNVGTSGKRASSWLSSMHSPAWAFFLTPPALPALPAASGGRPAGSDRSVGTAVYYGADKSRASPCAGPRCPSPDTHTWRVLRRSSSPDRVHSLPGLLSPTPGWSVPTSRESDPVGLVPTGSASPPHP